MCGISPGQQCAQRRAFAEIKVKFISVVLLCFPLIQVQILLIFSLFSVTVLCLQSLPPLPQSYWGSMREK